MEIEKFERLQEEFEHENYEKKNWAIKLILDIASYFGHVASISVGYFFIYKVFMDAAGDELNTGLIIISSIVFLALLELLKRVIFNRASFEIITKPFKKWTKEIWMLLVFSIGIVFVSFYFGLSGAMRFADKNEKIMLNRDKEIAVIDSNIKIKYATELSLLNSKLKGIETDRQQLQNEITQANTQITKLNNDKSNEENAYLKSMLQSQLNAETQRRDKLKTEMSLLVQTVSAERDSIESKIERDKQPLIKKLDSEYVEKQKTNSNSSIKFIFLIAIIETLILIGIYFKNIYNFSSYYEQKNNNTNSNNYQLWKTYATLLNLAYQNGKLNENDKCIAAAKVALIVKTKNNNITDKQIREFFDLINFLSIVEVHTSNKYRTIMVPYEEAIKRIQEHLNIK